MNNVQYLSLYSAIEPIREKFISTVQSAIEKSIHDMTDKELHQAFYSDYTQNSQQYEIIAA